MGCYNNIIKQQQKRLGRKETGYAIYHTDKPSYEECRRQRDCKRCKPACEERGNIRVSWAQRGGENEYYENDYESLEAYGRKH